MLLQNNVDYICAGESAIIIKLAANNKIFCSGKGYTNNNSKQSVEIVNFRPMQLLKYEAQLKYLIDNSVNAGKGVT